MQECQELAGTESLGKLGTIYQWSSPAGWYSVAGSLTQVVVWRMLRQLDPYRALFTGSVAATCIDFRDKRYSLEKVKK